jgi:aldose 1-epimerase
MYIQNLPCRRVAALLLAALFIVITPMHSLRAQTAAVDSVISKPFGKTVDGNAIQLYTLINKNGMSVSIATFGGTVIKLLVPDRKGNLDDVALGFSTIDPYFTKSPYFGALIGRYGNRIAKGKFTLDGTSYKLPTNDGENTLHGGKIGFDKHLWTAEIIKQSPPTVRFSRISPDGEQGFPGNLRVSVIYTLTDQNELKLQYAATTGKPTVLNLTSHIYFNLAGAGNGTILHHKIRIFANNYTPINGKLIPTGKISRVAGTPFDLRKWTIIGANIAAVGGVPVGFDHNYVLDHYPSIGPTLAAEVLEPRTGRLLKVYTNQPGIQFYTGNFLDGTLKGKNGKVYNQHDAFCLETQHFPDSPNQPNFPTTVLRPGETFKSTTIYRFSAK